MDGSAFDLDQFAPDNVSFTLGRRSYRLNGNPDVDVVANLLKIETAIKDAETTEETVAAVQAGKQAIVQLMMDVDVDQDVSALKLNVQQVLTLFALVVHGSSVAAIVASAISQGAPVSGGDAEAVSTDGSGTGERVGGGEAAPLVSASTSPARSSISDGIDDGLPVTGTA